ncbi:Uncharacterised protein [uncultured archaeon]|nr:Uncharacterised protein [uncultured archaeon]
MLVEAVIFLSLLFLAAASVFDIKSGEIPEASSVGHLAVVLCLAALASFMARSLNPLLFCAMLSAAYFIVGYIFFALGQWGGGDVKVIAAVGGSLALVSELGYPFNSMHLFPPTVAYFLNMGFISIPYVALYGLTLGLAHRQVFDRFVVFLKKTENILLFVLSWLPVAAAYIMHLRAIAAVYALLPAFLLLTLYLKAVEVEALRKKIPTKSLVEGDVLVDAFTVGNVTLGGNGIEGLSKEDASRLKKWATEGKIPAHVTVKWGIKFVPIFLLAYAVTLLYGNLLERILLLL